MHVCANKGLKAYGNTGTLKAVTVDGFYDIDAEDISDEIR